MKKLAVIGSGDLGQLIAHHAAHSHEVVGFFDDFKKKGEMVHGIPVLGGVADISVAHKNAEFDELSIGIGYKHFAFREAVFQQFQNEVKFANIIHPSCYVDPSCKLGEGLVMLPGCTLDQGVTLGDNVLLNTSCSISHDSRIGAHTFLSPRVAIAGFVTIGNRCNIGINSTIIDNINISNDIQTGGGTVVIKNLLEKGLYVGNPARFVK
ncbi:MAG: acetyltransferase [Flavobacteriaceae bacterium]|nr:acetyltransferase [Flavobacteriaceae bacterium]